MTLSGEILQPVDMFDFLIARVFQQAVQVAEVKQYI
jgi:hypothetical protein